MVRIKEFHIAVLLLVALPILFDRSALGSDLLAYKPLSEPFEYILNIETHAVIDTGSGNSQGGIFRDHVDTLILSQNVKDAGEGLLDISTTVKEINALPGGLTFGAAYERDEITGNTQHIKINLQGQVEEAKVIPHFGSSRFWRRGEDGPPLDIYNIMLMLNPRFHLGRLDEGSNWEVDDEIKLGLADAILPTGRKVPPYELEMTVKQKTRYTLLDFENYKGYRCARIGFEADFWTDGVMRDVYTGSYVEGNGRSTGEILFAPKKGLLVSVFLRHQVKERLSKDGQIVRFLNPEEMVFLYSDDRTSIPIPWSIVRTVTLELVNG